MSNHRQWVELDPTNGAGKPQDPPVGVVEDAAADQPVQDSAAVPNQAAEPER